MTRTGKSNTIKKVIQATAEISDKKFQDNPIGQIIFDVNGEYANPNRQDDGTAIYEQYGTRVERYSTQPKEGFKVMKINFFKQLERGQVFIDQYLKEGGRAPTTLKLSQRQPRRAAARRPQCPGATPAPQAAYCCCLHKAGFEAPQGFGAISGQPEHPETHGR